MGSMFEQSKLDSPFASAETLWLASSHVILSSERGTVKSRALLQTTAGLTVKRDVLISPSSKRTRWAASLVCTIAVLAALAAVAVVSWLALYVPIGTY